MPRAAAGLARNRGAVRLDTGRINVYLFAARYGQRLRGIAAAGGGDFDRSDDPDQHFLAEMARNQADFGHFPRIFRGPGG